MLLLTAGTRKIAKPLWGCFPRSSGRGYQTREQRHKGFLVSVGRTSRVRSGPAWAATQKHQPDGTHCPRAARPVIEGPGYAGAEW